MKILTHLILPRCPNNHALSKRIISIIRLRCFTLIAVMTSAFCSVASARIGESVEECKARYGVLEQGEKPNNYTARANGLVIVMQFLGDKCAMITYVKEKAERFSENELSILLDNNMGKGNWSWSAADATSVSANSRDGEILAACEKERLLVIVTKSGQSAILSNTKSDESSQLDGL